MIIRLERPADLSAIRALIAASFAVHPHSDRTEHHIVDRLRADGALTLSLVAVQDELIVGHVAFSPVHIADGSHGSHGWYGLGPLAVLSGYRRRGIGAALVVRGLDLLRQLDAAGCVVLGEPNYYARFGFHRILPCCCRVSRPHPSWPCGSRRGPPEVWSRIIRPSAPLDDFRLRRCGPLPERRTVVQLSIIICGVLMLAALSFLAGLVLAGYGATRWFREREDSLLDDIGQHYERRQRQMLSRIEDGDQALLAAYADLDRLEAQKALAGHRLGDARAELDTALAGRAALEQILERRTAALATAEVQLERLRRMNVDEADQGASDTAPDRPEVLAASRVRQVS